MRRGGGGRREEDNRKGIDVFALARTSTSTNSTVEVHWLSFFLLRVVA